MGKMKEVFMQMREEEIDDIDDSEYFQLMSDKDWQQYVVETEEEFRKTYGNSATKALLFSEWKKKNGLI